LGRKYWAEISLSELSAKKYLDEGSDSFRIGIPRFPLRRVAGIFVFIPSTA
jgi:hypothetical protein